NTDNSTTLTVKKVSSTDSGIYKVMAQNDAGEDSADFTITIKDKPSPPRDVRVKEVNKDYVVVTWDVPESDGGCPITGYLVEKKDAAKKTYIKADSTDAATLELKVTKLVEGKEYDIRFRVLAENKAGLSKPSDTTGRFKAKNPYDVPGRPETPEVSEITPDSATLKWEAPTSDGGSPITNYVIEMRTRKDLKWKKVNKDNITDTEFTVPGLKEGEEYEFRITAENKAGAGQPSKPSSSAKYVPPTIGEHQYEDKLVLKAGSAAAIEIPYSGCPQPKATWNYKSGKLPDAKRFKTDIIKTMTSMTIAKTQRSDSGKYTLLLENEYGSATFTIEVIVLGMISSKCFTFRCDINYDLIYRQTWSSAEPQSERSYRRHSLTHLGRSQG
ncbi:hypothetical protein CAPTEDRAFT_119763, partial [Capitella teleta]